MGSLEPNQEVQNSQEYQSLTTYLSSSSQSQSPLDTFCQPTESTFMKPSTASEVETQLWRAWKAVIATAAQTPHDSPGRQKLADFVLGLQKRPALQRDDGTVCKIWDDAMVWQDLPIFGPSMREAWNAAATDSSPTPSRTAWINLNAFTATLLSTTYSHNSTLSPSTPCENLSLYAIWTIRMSLEEGESPSKDQTSLQAAAAWFAHAAPALWALSCQGREFEGKIAKQGQGMQGKEWRGFGRERWGVWRERLEGADAGEDKVGLVGRAREAVRGVKEE